MKDNILFYLDIRTELVIEKIVVLILEYRIIHYIMYIWYKCVKTNIFT